MVKENDYQERLLLKPQGKSSKMVTRLENLVRVALIGILALSGCTIMTPPHPEDPAERHRLRKNPVIEQDLGNYKDIKNLKILMNLARKLAIIQKLNKNEKTKKSKG